MNCSQGDGEGREEGERQGGEDGEERNLSNVQISMLGAWGGKWLTLLVKWKN